MTETALGGRGGGIGIPDGGVIVAVNFLFVFMEVLYIKLETTSTVLHDHMKKTVAAVQLLSSQSVQYRLALLFI